MEFKTQILIFGLRFTCSFTFSCSNLATVCMVIKNMFRWSNFSTWWLRETSFPNNKLRTKSFQFWELSRFKVHDIIWWSSLISLKDFSIEWLKLFEIKISWLNHVNHFSESIPSWHWFIDWIITNNVRIGRECISDLVLEGNIFVLETKVIFIESSEQGERFWRCVIIEETLFETIFNHWKVCFLVDSVSIIFQWWHTSSEFFHKRFHHCIRIVSDTKSSFINNIKSMEIWPSFTTIHSCICILMSINKSIDSSLSKSRD